MARTTKQVIDWRFRRSRTFNPEGIRTAFRDDSEHHRSVATLASRLCRKCSASSRETCPERSGGKMPLAEKGARGKGRQPLSPPQHTEAPEGEQRSGNRHGETNAISRVRLNSSEFRIARSG